MSTWNYRVMKRVLPEGDYYGIHHVYYNNKGEVTSWSTNSIIGYFDSVEEITDTLELMKLSLTKEVLNDTN